MKRLCVFFFYDHQGIVDEYVEVLLEGMKKSVDRFVIVCNGLLKPEGRRIFRKFTDTVIVRENKGLDVWAYKTAIDFLGWEEICSYDEFIMMNHTICGPLFPFGDMFTEMDGSDVDFWGITMYYGGGCTRPTAWPDNGYEYVQDHIQSHFIAVRSHMLKSHEFQKYWSNIPEINSYSDSVSFHESVFTRRFSDMGFTYRCYIDCDDVSDYDVYPLMFNSHVLIRDKKCPIIKRKRNVLPFVHVRFHDSYYGLRDMTDAIEECTHYDMDLVYKNTLRTSSLYDYQRGTVLGFISSEKDNVTCKPVDKKKTGIILNVNNYEYFKYFKEYLNHKLSGFNLIVIAGKDNDVGQYLGSDVNIVASYDLENSGQLFTVIEEQSDNYEYLFILSFNTLKNHCNKSFDYNTLLMEFDSFFNSINQINSVTDILENNKVLGLLVPPLPVLGFNPYDYSVYRTQNFKRVMQYSEYIEVMNSEENHYHFPANNIFACKTKAVKGFAESLEKCFGFTNGLSYDLLLPLYVQSKGYYSARVMTEYNAKMYTAMLEELLYTKGVLK